MVMTLEKLMEYDKQLKEFAEILKVDYKDEKFLDLMAEYWPPSNVDIKDIFEITELKDGN